MPQQISDKIHPSKLATKTQKTIEKQRQTHIGVEETTLLEKGKPRYGEENDGRDIKPRMTKKNHHSSLTNKSLKESIKERAARISGEKNKASNKIYFLP